MLHDLRERVAVPRLVLTILLVSALFTAYRSSAMRDNQSDRVLYHQMTPEEQARWRRLYEESVAAEKDETTPLVPEVAEELAAARRERPSRAVQDLRDMTRLSAETRELLRESLAPYQPAAPTRIDDPRPPWWLGFLLLYMVLMGVCVLVWVIASTHVPGWVVLVLMSLPTAVFLGLFVLDAVDARLRGRRG